MNIIYRVRGVLCDLYMRSELIVKSILKFIVYFWIFRQMAGWEGFASTGILNAVSVHLLLALICVLLPSRFVGLFACFIVIYNVYLSSFWGALLIAIVLLLLYILVARLSPDESFLFIMMPFAMRFNAFLALPLFGGLYLGVFSAIPMIGGILLWGILKIIPAFLQFNVEKIDQLPAAFSEMADYVINQLFKNETFIFMGILCLAITIVVFLINKLNFKYVRYISLIIGTVLGMLCLLIGRQMDMMDISIGAALWTPLLSFLVLVVIEFFHMALNYQMAQKLVFADDEYYYYVSAIPKILGKKKGQAEVKTITNAAGSAEGSVPAAPSAQPYVPYQPSPVSYEPYAAKEAAEPAPVSGNESKKDAESSNTGKEKKGGKGSAGTYFKKARDFGSRNLSGLFAEQKSGKAAERNAAGNDAGPEKGSESPLYDEPASELTGFIPVIEEEKVPSGNLFADVPLDDGEERPVQYADDTFFGDEPEEVLSAPKASGDDLDSRIAELKERTGWSEETIKGFLAEQDQSF